MIEITDIVKEYRTDDGTLSILSGASVSIEPGTFAAICGPSGCGKSTLLLILGGLLHPDRGSSRQENHGGIGNKKARNTPEVPVRHQQ